MNIIFDLQRFAEGGAGAAPGVAGQAAADQGTTSSENVNKTSENAAEDRKARFKEVRKEFEQEFNGEISDLMQKRNKKNNEKIARLTEFRNKSNKIFESLAVKYGLDATDIDGLVSAVDKDNSYFENEAYERGLSVDEFRRINKIENENKKLVQSHKAQEEAMRRQQFARRINQEISIASSFYPNFNIETEAQNPAFTRLVESGVDVKTAYEVLHRDDFEKSIREKTASEVASKIQIDAANNSKRPAENGLKNSSAVNMSLDFSKLTAKEIDDYINRSKNGERIDFKNNF